MSFIENILYLFWKNKTTSTISSFQYIDKQDKYMKKHKQNVD